MSICLPPQIRWPTDLLPEFLRTCAQPTPSANNSACLAAASKMQFQTLQQLPRTARSRIPEFLALYAPCFSYSWRAPKTLAAASPFIEIRRAQMRNDPDAFIFTQFRKPQRHMNFRSEATSPRTEPLRFFRDLIIFRENPRANAQ